VFYLFLALILITASIKTALKGSLTFFANNFDLPVLLLALTYLASTFFRTPNKMEAFFLPGTTTLILITVLVFWVGKGFSEGKKGLTAALATAGAAVSLISLLAFTGAFAKVPQLPEFIKNTLFSPLGSKLNEVIYLAVIFPLGIGLVLKEAKIIEKTFWLIILAIIGLNLVVSTYNLLPGKPASPVLPNLTTSWAVATESLKVSPLLGTGPGNYLGAFNRFRPISYNATPIWTIRFITAQNFVLTLITETGILGLIALLYLVWKMIRSAKTISTDPYLAISLGLALIFLFIFPAHLTEIAVLALILALATKSRPIHLQIPHKVISAMIVFLVVFGLGIVGFWGNRAFAAEYRYKKTIDALVKNDGRAAYNLILQTVGLNPRVDRYHLSSAQINLALVRALVQKKDLTETDKQAITKLISQAINEAKTAVALNPNRAGNWEVLARTYQSIMPFAQGADNFAIQTFSQAVALDPLNTGLRISLGGIYYALGRYDEAIDAFKLAVLTKPDHANAHYNLAAAYREKGEVKKATEEINTVLTLVGKDTADYETAQKELKNLEGLTAPQPAGEPLIKPPLELPKEATPPVTP
jgi:tetratricopeptide (TPR) repeat protein